MEWYEYSNNMFEKYKQAEKPFQITYELTPFCNFRCNMCYIRLDPEQAKEQGKLLNTEQWLQIASESRKMGAVILEVTGGEAATRPDFPVLYEAFIKMGFIIHLRTNGYLIRDEILDMLKRNRPRRISITFYGASDKMYQKVCGISDGFSVVSKNVLAMRDAGFDIRLTMTVTNENINDLEALQQWGKAHNLTIIPFGGLFTPIRSAKRSIDHLQVQMPEEEYIITEDIIQTTQHEIVNRKELMNPFWMCRVFGAKCCISWDGRVTLCNTMTSIWKDVFKNGLDKAYHDLYEDLKKLRRPPECASCQFIEFCGACPSQLLSATDNPELTCDNICKLARRKYKRNYLVEYAKREKSHDVIIDQCEEGERFDEN